MKLSLASLALVSTCVYAGKPQLSVSFVFFFHDRRFELRICHIALVVDHYRVSSLHRKRRQYHRAL